MKNAFSVLFSSATFWTSLISIAGMLLLRLTPLPEDIWTGIATFLGSCIVILFGKEVSTDIGRGFARGMQDYREEDKRNLTLMGRG